MTVVVQGRTQSAGGTMVTGSQELVLVQDSVIVVITLGGGVVTDGVLGG